MQNRFVCRCPEGKPYGSRAFRKPCMHGILAAWCLETCRPGMLFGSDNMSVPQAFGAEYLQMGKNDEQMDEIDDNEIREMLEALEGRDGREPGEIV